MSQWRKDKKWSDRFIPEITRILGENLITEPPSEEDAERNTDLMVLKLDAVRIGCRIRKHNYVGSFGAEFTIRAGRPSGAKTELSKIIEGWGDYFFYGFCDEDERKLDRWFLGDMRVFRTWFVKCCYTDKHKWSENGNHDGSSWFMGIKLCDMPPDFVVASNWYEVE